MTTCGIVLTVVVGLAATCVGAWLLMRALFGTERMP